MTSVKIGRKVFRKRVGYGKVCRVVEMNHEKWGQSGGDNEPPALLLTLATRHPDVEWVVTARNSGWESPLPNIVNPWIEWNTVLRQNSRRVYRVDDQSVEALNFTVGLYDELTNKTLVDVDEYVLWMGQHGTSNSPLPSKKDRRVYTKPQISAVHYGGYQLRGLNCWRYHNPIEREEVWLLADPRNHIKCRDLMWPRRHPILTQFNFERGENLERYGDTRTPVECGFDPKLTQENWPGVWRTHDCYVASGLELVGIPPELHASMPGGWDQRDHDFGILINEARGYGLRPEMSRLHAMQHYVAPLNPSWVFGTWSSGALGKLGYDIKPLPYGQIFDLMQRTKTTFTTPSSGSEWATAKPWESFASGVICFFHPKYDTQNHILFPDGRGNATEEQRQLAAWLRVKTPEELAKKVRAVTSSRETYEWLATVQWVHLRREFERQRCVTMIEERLGL